MIRSLTAFPVFIPLVMAVATATVIRVPQDQPTIQSGIDAAIDGETVLVDTGRYVENMRFRDKEMRWSIHSRNQAG